MGSYYDYHQNTKNSKTFSVLSEFTNIRAPIVLFVYNRPWHTRQTVEALQRCELASESDLYLFADGPKSDVTEKVHNQITEVRQYIHTIDGFKSIHIKESTSNKGLANSVIQGVDEVINQYGNVIVLEDDIIVHPFFIRFMNEALGFYRQDHRIFSIGAFIEPVIIPPAYLKDVFISPRIETWGWGTWIDRWETANWDINSYEILKKTTKSKIKKLCKGGDDLWPLLQAQAAGKIDSWAARWQYNLTISNGYCLRPKKNFVCNIGMDGSGTHCGNTIENTNNKWNQQKMVTALKTMHLQSTPMFNHEFYDIQMVPEIEEDKSIILAIQRYFRHPHNSTREQIKHFLKYLIHGVNSLLYHFNYQKKHIEE